MLVTLWPDHGQVRRDPGELAMQRPMVGLAIDGSEAEVAGILSRMGGSFLEETSLVQVSTSFFSARPVLRTLQVGR